MSRWLTLLERISRLLSARGPGIRILGSTAEHSITPWGRCPQPTAHSPQPRWVVGCVLVRGLIAWLLCIPSAWAHNVPPRTGTVTDVLCYVEYNGPTDPSSKAYKQYLECAKRGIPAGHPVALKIDGQYYLVVDVRFQAMNATFVPLVGQQVTVQGHLLEADGLHVIAVERLFDESKETPARHP